MTDKIAVLGAGSIGAYLGGSLIAAGGEVVLVGRRSMRERIATHGLRLSDLAGRHVELAPDRIRYSEDPAALAGADLILVTVKSRDTAGAAELIARHAPATTLVVSMQNGVSNADVLRAGLPGYGVLAGVVPFNVLQTPDGRLHRGTEGELLVESSARLQRWLPLFRRALLPLQQEPDFAAVQWGKLLMNLNNPVNALSGLPLRQQLAQRAYRRSLALLIAEALVVLKQAGIRPARLGRIHPALLPHLLRVPDMVFTRLAATMLRIDPEARSSMWEDLAAGRPTEVDEINGAVLRLAASVGIRAPINQRMVELIKALPAGKLPHLSGKDMYQTLLSAG